MFSGEEEIVKLQFDNSLVNVVIDRFGNDITIEKVNEANFAIRVNVAVSSAFMAWIFQFGEKVKILYPESVIDKYKETLQATIKQYI